MPTDKAEAESIIARQPAHKWHPARVFVVAWLAYSVYRITALVLLKAVQPSDSPSYGIRIVLGLLDGALVGLCTLMLVAVCERLPVEKPYRFRNACANVALAFACAVATLSVLFVAGRLIAPDVETLSWLVFLALSVTHSLFVFLAITATVQAAAYQRRARERERDALSLRAQLTSARLESLRAKLQPHFLFNTLNGISDLIFTDPEKADTLVLRLAQLLRATLDTVHDEISVREELAMLATYFQIERVRFGDRLRVSIDADREANDARVPPFLVQPLAENAIQHGIAPRSGGGAVTVRATVRHEHRAPRLVLELSDDGVGMPANAAEGLGLRITRQRLHTMYRGAGVLSVRPRPGGGTVATIELPLASAAQ
jgi:signal transduction histidine kinase